MTLSGPHVKSMVHRIRQMCKVRTEHTELDIASSKRLTSLPDAMKLALLPPKQERMMKRPCLPPSTLYSMDGLVGMPTTSPALPALPMTHQLRLRLQVLLVMPWPTEAGALVAAQRAQLGERTWLRGPNKAAMLHVSRCAIGSSLAVLSTVLSPLVHRNHPWLQRRADN